MTTAVIARDPLAIVSIIHNDKPDPVFWPNGVATHGTSVGYSVGEWQFVSVQYDAPPNRFYAASGDPVIDRLDGSVLHMRRHWEPASLADAKAELIAAVDTAAELKRLTYITPGAGQAMVYLQKFAEAQAFFKAISPSPADYPLLSASAGDGSLKDVAVLVLQTAAQWTLIAADIEKSRLKTKAAISAVQTVDEALAAFNAVIWP